MSSRSILIPFFLVALTGLGRAMSSGPEPQGKADSIQRKGAPEHVDVPFALGAAEREELQRASAASPQLAELRGGQASDHDLNVALLVVGIVLIVILI